MTKSEDHSARLRAEAKQHELEHRQYLPKESEIEYYCRVIIPEIRSITMNYQDEALSITPNLLKFGYRSDAIFAVRGSTKAVSAFLDELMIKMNGETPGSNSSRKSTETICGPDVHFIEVNIPSLNSWTDARVEILVPSVSAMFDMQIWSHAKQRK